MNNFIYCFYIGKNTEKKRIYYIFILLEHNVYVMFFFRYMMI